MSTVHQDSDDNPPCVAPPVRSGIYRVLGALSFPGGPVSLEGMRESHNGPTPTTLSSAESNQALAEHTVKEMLETLTEVQRLIERKRFDEARFELGQVRRLTEEAQRWLE